MSGKEKWDNHTDAAHDNDANAEAGAADADRQHDPYVSAMLHS